MADHEESHPVVLYVYDLSQGLARQLSTSLLGKAIEGIWHTSVNVYGLEYYYSGGIAKGLPNQSAYGHPVKVVELGSTQVPKDVFEEFLNEISPRYTAQTYSLLKHNCNNFSNEVTQFLVGTEIPTYILRLPEEVMATPMAALILPMIEQMETNLRYGNVPQVPHLAVSTGQATRPSTSSQVPPAVVMKGASYSSGEGISNNNIPPTTITNTNTACTSTSATTLEDAKAKVHEEIRHEFSALMAAGGLRASEAAALAARKVMQKHGVAAGVPSNAASRSA